MADSFSELEASSLFCPRCKQANPVRKRLLLVLPSGNKYDYACSECGTQVGGKTDSNSADFHPHRPLGHRGSASSAARGMRRGVPRAEPARICLRREFGLVHA
jgi:hypothetical protein